MQSDHAVRHYCPGTIHLCGQRLAKEERWVAGVPRPVLAPMRWFWAKFPWIAMLVLPSSLVWQALQVLQLTSGLAGMASMDTMLVQTRYLLRNAASF